MICRAAFPWLLAALVLGLPRIATATDSDGDGLTDAWEVAHFGHLNYGAADDSDGDGYLNIYEFSWNTDPSDVSTYPGPTRRVDPADTNAYPTIQAALNAITGLYEVVTVASGLYTGSANRDLDFGGAKAMLVATGGLTQCTIDGQYTGRGFYFHTSESNLTVVSGFTVTRGGTNNSSSSQGGGAAFASASPTVRNTRLRHNEAYRGAGLHFQNASPRLWNMLVYSNQSTYGHSLGAALYIDGGSPEIRNTTIAHNRSTHNGGVRVLSGSPSFQNSIIWSNWPHAQISGGTPTVTYSCVHGGHTGVGNITNNPQFADSLYRLSITSPCIDAGTNGVVMTDWEGNPRWDVPEVTNAVSGWDMGASELIDYDEDGLPDWWETEFLGSVDWDELDDADNDGVPNLYEFKHHSLPGDANSVPQPTHHVAFGGSHTSPYSSWATAASNLQAALTAATDDYAIIAVSNGVYTGAQNRDLSVPAQPLLLYGVGGRDVTVIDPQASGRVAALTSGQTRHTVFSGFTVTNAASSGEDYGGAFLCDGASMTILDSRFVYCSSYAGGALCSMYGSSPRIERSIFKHCESEVSGGAIVSVDGGLIRSSVFAENHGGLGGAIETYHSDMCIQNCTIVSNFISFGGSGGGIYGWESPLIENCILWNNQYGQMDLSGSPQVRYSLVKGGWSGVGNITNDPQFADSHYRLSVTSPCIDAGTNNAVLSDWEGNLRWDVPEVTNVVSSWDIGAAELNDYDTDGLPDWWELAHFGSTNAHPNDDQDGDGYLNVYEAIHHSTPTSGSSIPLATLAITTNSGLTIQAAIDSVTSDYAVVTIGPGVWSGTGNKNLDLGGKRMTLASVSGPLETIIDAGGSGRGFWFGTAETRASVVAGFTIQNGTVAGTGGGLLFTNGSPSILDCILQGNQAARGGGIYGYNSSARVERCVVTNNQASSGDAGAAFDGGAQVFAASDFSHNTATAIFAGAGGLGLYKTLAVISNCTFVGNVSSGVCGGVYFEGGSNWLAESVATLNELRSPLYGGGITAVGWVDIRRCIVSDNTSVGLGGGLYVDSVDGNMIADCTVSGNVSTGSGGGGRLTGVIVTNCHVYENTSGSSGGGLSVENAQIVDCTISNNVAAGDGGGLRLTQYHGGPYATNAAPPLLRGCLITRNVAANGGGVYLSQDAYPGASCDTCLITENVATDVGGGAAFGRSSSGGASIKLQNSAFLANQSTTGGGIYLDDWGSGNTWASISNCTVHLNAATAGGGIGTDDDDVLVLSLVNSVIWSNGPSPISVVYTNRIYVDHACIQGDITGAASIVGLVSGDPMLAQDGYHLFSTNSSCFNSGSTTGLAEDIDGEARPTLGALDIGCDEFADSDSDGLADYWEHRHFGHLTNAAAGDDPDGDRMSNGEEYIHGYDPLVAQLLDSDQDGLSDAREQIAGTDVNVPDTDGDGIFDGWELDNGLNPLVNDLADDLDGDGLNNLQEWQRGTSVTNGDSDADGLLDGEETHGTRFGYKSDPLDSDTDDDGIGDGSDLFTASPVDDQDGDGSTDGVDGDSDNDGVSDGSEPDPNAAMRPDRDGDGVPDGVDGDPDDDADWGTDLVAPGIVIVEPQAGAAL